MTRGAHQAPAGRRHALPGRPFHVPDELTCYFDTPDEPANIHLEMRIPGRLDQDAFRDAAATALLANVRASSRRARRGLLARGYAWEHPARLDLDPVSFTTFTDAAELAATRDAFIARSPSVDRSPPALLLVASGPDCDYVLLNAHHATMDGLSWLDLLRDLAGRYRMATAVGQRTVLPAAARLPATTAPATTLPATTLPADTAPADTAPAGGRRASRWFGWLPARIAAEHGGRRGCGVHLLLLPGVPAVPAEPAGEKVTLNDALIAAFVVTAGRWNDEHGRRPRRVRVTVPFNARSTDQRDAAGNHSRIVTIVATPPRRDCDLRSLLLEVASQVRAARQNPGPQVPGGSRGLAAAWCPAAVKRLVVRVSLRTAGPLVCDTAMVTNLGRVADPPDFGLPGTMTMGLSGPAQMPRGLSVAAITAGDRVQLGLRFNRKLLDDAAAARFMAGYAHALGALTCIDAAESDPGTWQRDRSFPAGTSA